MADLLRHLKGVRKSGEGWTARCPAHDDKQNSLSVHFRDGRWLLKCHAGCDVESITRSIDLSVGELFDHEVRGRGEIHPSGNRATAQPSAASGLTLEQYATAKRLPLDLLRGCGVSEITYDGRPAVRIPYFGPGGELSAVRFRARLLHRTNRCVDSEHKDDEDRILVLSQCD